MKRLQSLLTSFAIAAVMLVGAAPTHAAPLNLQHAPLFLNQAVEPNLAVTFDDSGSMARGYMPEIRAEFTGQPNGNGEDLGQLRGQGDDGNWSEPWATWSGYNSVYYDPNVTYGLPRQADGSAYPDVSFNDAPADGYDPNAAGSNIDLATEYFLSWGCCNNDGPNRIENGTFNYDDGNGARYPFPFGDAAFYHTFSGNPADPASIIDVSNYTAVRVDTLGADQRTNFARWFSYYRTRLLASKSGITLGFSSITAPIRVAWQGLNDDQFGTTDPIRTLSATQRTDFWDYIDNDWDASGGTPVRAATERAGTFFSRSGLTDASPYYDAGLGRELSCRQNYHVTVTDGGWNSAAGLSGDIDNQSWTFPDGTTYDPAATHAQVYSNEDANADGFADNAFHYWATDLRTDLPNNVPQYLADTTTGVTGTALATLPADPFSVDEIYWNPRNDPATWQHMVHFNVGLGVNGEIPLTDASLTSLRDGTLEWPSFGTGETAGKIDDNWHAAVNSRGRYFSASNPNELVRQLSQVLNSIVARNSSASAVAVSSGVVTTTAQSFRTQFNSGDWTGTVQSISVESILAGAEDVEWDAGCNLTGGTCDSNPNQLSFLPANSRNIKITNSSGDLVDFLPGNVGALATATVTALNTAPDGTTDGRASDRILFLRGERGNELQNGGDFRDRNSVLGDIINSGAVFVQGRASGYDGGTSFFAGDGPEDLAQYQTFLTALETRDGVIYAGANDGMLHAFDADTGVERWAMIPSPVQRNLAALTDPQYVKQSYVDAGPAVRDVFIGGSWRTYALGGLRFGGQGFYALDITDPSAGPVLLWEFTDQEDADLGYTYGEPFIARIQHNDKWVGLLPSGYNSDAADGTVGSGDGALFVVDLADGSVIKKFGTGDFGQSVNGLGPPVAGDYGADFEADVAFAGDLDGNVWRFDLTGDPSTWDAEKIYQPSTVGDQPITARPTVIARDYDGALMVMVGTGKYIEPSDRVTSVPMQYMLGIVDRSPGNLVPGSSPAQLSEMSQIQLATSGTDNRVFQSAPNFDRANDEGWYIELNEPGERVVTLASGRASTQRIVFSTLIPAGDDPCLSGGTSFIISANVNDGGPPDAFASFDFTNDGVVDLADFKFAAGLGAGKKVQGLVAGVTPVVRPGGGEAIGLVGGDTGDNGTTIIVEPAFEWVRRGWRQMQLED